MQFNIFAVLLVAGSTMGMANVMKRDVEAAAALPKANEYQSGDCSGQLNFGHHGFISSVNIDPSSHSVYLAGASWHAYTEPNLSGNNNGCKGAHLGALGGACQNLDNNAFGVRIQCVQAQ